MRLLVGIAPGFGAGQFVTAINDQALVDVLGQFPGADERSESWHVGLGPQAGSLRK